MSTPTTDRRIRVHDLIDRPGASRRVELDFDAPDDVGRELVAIDGPLRFTGVLESVVDGILVRGRLSARLELTCARCLTPVEADVDVEVVELFSPPGGAGDEVEEPEEGYELLEGELDLDTLLRDALVPAVPYQPLCDEACAGLCPTCGVDRNTGSCNCVDDHVDDRWAALEALELPEE